MKALIHYSHPEAREFALLLARALDDDLSVRIIERGTVISRDEATHLSRFYWRMVDECVARPRPVPFEGSAEFWTETLLNAISGYLRQAGYGGEWEDVADKS